MTLSDSHGGASASSGKTVFSAAFALMLACTLFAIRPSFAQDPGASEAIRHVIGSTFDQPGNKVQTDPLVVQGDHALAAWTQGSHGGRALLRREGGQWQIVLCAGKSLTEVAMLKQSGVPEKTANGLARQIAAAEAQVPPERRRQFDLFDPAAAATRHGAAHGSAPSSHSSHSH